MAARHLRVFVLEGKIGKSWVIVDWVCVEACLVYVDDALEGLSASAPASGKGEVRKLEGLEPVLGQGGQSGGGGKEARAVVLVLGIQAVNKNYARAVRAEGMGYDRCYGGLIVRGARLELRDGELLDGERHGGSWRDARRASECTARLV